MDSQNPSVRIQRCIERLLRGDLTAREELLSCAGERMQRLTHKILRDFPQVQRWEETADVMQNASLRLYRAIESVQLTDSRHFFRLAALQIRRELIDLARHYQGPQGAGAHYVTQAPADAGNSTTKAPFEAVEATQYPQKIAEWADCHPRAGELPEEEREVFDLLWYHGISQDEAAAVLNCNVRTIKRRWRAARLRLADVLACDQRLSDSE
ncbi:MAG: sigma-70 family RNA polymerase sigma factor [Planctomycetota bacterium]|nr:sigma-70 family RNA polymerase sigma factor [Planctomycetota bacterium]